MNNLNKIATNFESILGNKRLPVEQHVINEIINMLHQAPNHMVRHANGTKLYKSGPKDSNRYVVVSAKGVKSYFDNLEEAASEAIRCGRDQDYVPGVYTMQEILDKYERDNKF